MLRRLMLVAGLLSALAAPAHGQVTVGLSAFGGGYLPVSDLFDRTRLGTLPILNLGQEPGFLVGGRLTVWLSRLAVEAEAAYALSRLDMPEQAKEFGVEDQAGVFLGSLNVLYVFFQAPFSPLSLYVSGGAGLVSRGGDYLDTYEGTTDVTGAVGAGLRFGLRPLMHVRFDIRDYISSFKPTNPQGEELDAKLQNDIVATLALEFAFSPMR
jgi:hypothetical protein